jgi:drug/metabolite transporter (DMT)-like permease
MISKRFSYTVSAALLWAFSIILTRMIFQSGENVYSVFLWGSLLSAPFWIWMVRGQKEEIKKLKKSDYWILAGMGLISAVGVNLAELLALKYGSAVNFSFLIRMVIVFTIIFAYIFLGEKITKRKIVLTILLLIGAYLFTTQGKMIQLSKGDIFTLIEAAFLAIGNNVLGKMATNRMSTNLAASGTFFTSVIPIAILGIIGGGVSLPSAMGLIMALVIVNIFLTLTRFRAYKHGNASYVTMVFSFTPVFVSLMAIPLLGESLTTIQIVGGALIVGAAILVEALKI